MKTAVFAAGLRGLADEIERGDSFEGIVRYTMAEAPDELLVEIMVRDGTRDGRGRWIMLNEIKDRR